MDPHHEFDLPPPDGFGTKEVHAFFGLTAYLGQVLEKGLMNMAVALQLRNAGRLTREFADELFDTMETQTFGQLLKAAREFIAIPQSLDAPLGAALNKRNYLAHHFFAVHSENFMSEVGRKERFKATDSELDKIFLPLSKRLGFTQERVEAELALMRARAEARDAE
jgi:hypothetical protein